MTPAAVRVGRAPALLVVALSACGEGGPSTPAFERADSAGVEVVVDHAPVWSEVDAWRLSAEPRLDIGGSGRGAEYELYQVAGAHVLSDGRLVVANRSSGELRFYDAEGTYLFAAGGKGEGPGEFSVISTFAVLPGDTLVVFDGWAERLTTFAPDGSLVHTASTADVEMGAFLAYVLGNGSLLRVGQQGFGIDAPNGLQRRAYTIAIQVPGTAALDTLGSWPGSQWFVRTEGRSVHVTRPLFATDTHVAPSGASVWIGNSERFEIQEVDRTGRVERIVRIDRPIPEMTSDLYAQAIEARLANTHDATVLRESRRAFAELPQPERVPAFATLQADDEGNVWAMSYPLPGDSAETWHVIANDGRWLGDVQTPARFGPLHIGVDFVVGVLRDDIDVEHVVRYALIKGPG